VGLNWPPGLEFETPALERPHVPPCNPADYLPLFCYVCEEKYTHTFGFQWMDNGERASSSQNTWGESCGLKDYFIVKDLEDKL
jgi:hypothetical protein